MACPARAAAGRPCARAGQRQHAALRIEPRAPECELPLALAGIEPAALPQRVVGVLDRQRREPHRRIGRVRAVERGEFVEHHAGRPAVRHDVVHGQREHVMRRVEPDQVRTHERRDAQVERLRLVRRRDLVGARGPLRRGERRQVRLAPRAAQRRVDRLRDAVGRFVESRAQRLVARDQRVAREPQRMRVERARQREPLGDVIRVACVDQPLMQPQPRLRERRRHALAARRARRNRQHAEIDAGRAELVDEHRALRVGQLRETRRER
ncbi:hypothetical protein BST28156_06868 [Burkholderia stagnalis]|nr:hypothetical protein BST28156_06868 [Burkholderia stagnalis]